MFLYSEKIAERKRVLKGVTKSGFDHASKTS
jgi:hypothetical protein